MNVLELAVSAGKSFTLLVPIVFSSCIIFFSVFATIKIALLVLDE